MPSGGQLDIYTDLLGLDLSKFPADKNSDKRSSGSSLESPSTFPAVQLFRLSLTKCYSSLKDFVDSCPALLFLSVYSDRR